MKKKKKINLYRNSFQIIRGGASQEAKIDLK